MCLAIPGKILSITGDDPLSRSGRVSFGGIVKEVSLACVPEAAVEEYVLVHVGFAISTVDRAEAERVFALLEQLGALDELDDDAGGGGPQP
jgi:hydrogenase expression/formation protein HypC